MKSSFFSKTANLVFTRRCSTNCLQTGSRIGEGEKKCNLQHSPQNLLLFLAFCSTPNAIFLLARYITTQQHNFDPILLQYIDTLVGRWRWRRWWKWGALCSNGECCWPTLVFIWSTFAMKDHDKRFVKQFDDTVVSIFQIPIHKNVETERYSFVFAGQEWMQFVTEAFLSKNRILHFWNSDPYTTKAFFLASKAFSNQWIKVEQKIEEQQFYLSKLKSVKTQLGLWGL